MVRMIYIYKCIYIYTYIYTCKSTVCFGFVMFLGIAMFTDHLGVGRVNEAEGRDVRPPVLEVVQVHQVEVQAGDQVVVVGGHHAHSLCR